MSQSAPQVGCEVVGRSERGPSVFNYSDDTYNKLTLSLVKYRNWEFSRRIFSILGLAFLLAIMASGFALALGLANADLMLGLFFGCFALAKAGEGICVCESVYADRLAHTYMPDAYPNAPKGRSSKLIANFFFYAVPSFGLAFISIVMSSYWVGFGEIGSLATVSIMQTLMPILTVAFLISCAYRAVANQRDSERNGEGHTLLSGKASFYLQVAGAVPTFVVFFKFNMFMSIGGLSAVAGPLAPVALLILCALLIAIVALYKYSHKGEIKLPDLHPEPTPNVLGSDAKSAKPELLQSVSLLDSSAPRSDVDSKQPAVTAAAPDPATAVLTIKRTNHWTEERLIAFSKENPESIKHFNEPSGNDQPGFTRSLFFPCCTAAVGTDEEKTPLISGQQQRF